MQYAMQVFEDPDNDEFRVIDREGEPWFVLVDVCRKLDIAQPASAARVLDEDEKDVLSMHTPGGYQKMTVVSESGLYSLILRSRKESAKAFRKWVTAEVLPSIRKTGGYGTRAIPAFIRRFNENWDRVSAGHFSVFNEMVVHLWGRFEMAGHVMADRAPDGKENRPDVSAGRLFSDWLKEKHPTVSSAFSYYMHKTPEWEGEVRQYPRSILHLFLEFLDEEWIPNHAPRYFKTRDAAALPYLQKILPSPEKPKPGMMRQRFIGRGR